MSVRVAALVGKQLERRDISHLSALDSTMRADVHQIPPTQFRSTTSRKNDLHQRIPVTDGVALGFRGVCDTVLTQNANALRRM